MNKVRIFVSSVQKELANERQVIAQLCLVDTFLHVHTEAVLFEKVPTSGKPNKKGYIECLDSCQVYLLVLDLEYGRASKGELSATHEEYRHARKRGLPVAVFMKGLDSATDGKREPKTRAFIDEIKRDGHKYQRFHDRKDLEPGVREAIYEILKLEFSLTPSRTEEEEADHQVEAASDFETTPESAIPITSLYGSALSDYVEIALPEAWQRIWDDSPADALVARGLALAQERGNPMPIQAAVLLFHPRPADRLPQCEILASGEELTSRMCQEEFGVSAPIIAKDFKALLDLGIAVRLGAGPSTRYRIGTAES